MKKLIGSLLALLLFSQAPLFSQSELVLVIDQSTQQINWLDGFSITKTSDALVNNWFGSILLNFSPTIDSPLLGYSEGVSGFSSYRSRRLAWSCWLASVS